MSVTKIGWQLFIMGFKIFPARDKIGRKIKLKPYRLNNSVMFLQRYNKIIFHWKRKKILLILLLDFNGDGKPDNITFMIKRIKVHNSNALKDSSYRFPGNYGVEKFLELFSGKWIFIILSTLFSILCILTRGAPSGGAIGTDYSW